MISNALISVIIPIYNVAPYLSRCLDSVIAQTYPHWEAILVDDLSTDDSWSICQDYSAKDNRIKAIQLPSNSGASAARIDGLKTAQGKFIMFVDSDDWLHHTMLETMLDTIQSLNVDIVQCGYTMPDTFQKTNKSIYIDRTKATIISSTEAIRQLYGEGQGNGFCYLLWNKIYRKSCILIDVLPRDNLSINDVPFIPRIAYCAQSVALCDEPLYYYYQRNDQSSTMDITKQSYFNMSYEHFKAFDNISNYFMHIDHDMYTLSMKLTVTYALSLLKAKPMDKTIRTIALNTIQKAPKETLLYLPKNKRLLCKFIRLLPHQHCISY